MSDEQIRALALIATVNANVAGMVALNDYRKALGQQIAYDDAAFFMEADRLKSLVEGKPDAS